MDHRVETRHYRALVFPERPPPELQRVTNTTLFWDCDPSLQSWKLVEFRKVFSAAPIFHVRRRLARNGFASHACCAWRFTASACELDAVEQSSCHDNDNFRISGGILTPSHYRPVDAHRGNFGCVARDLTNRQIMTIAGDRWVTVLLGTIGCAVAMLGPGLRSVDARLFGWKRVVPLRKISLNS